jgi:hypothetical protein
MADTTLPALLDTGTHAGRPAASAVGSGGLYSCTDHDLIYQTDGSSWTTWADVTGGSADLSGEELDYVQGTATVSVTGTSEGAANTLLTGTSQAYEAVPTLIEVFCPRVTTGASSGASVIGILMDGASVLGRIFLVITPAAAALTVPVHAAYRLTPTAATHQYIVKAWRQTADGSWTPGAGGAGTEVPAFIRITRV